MNKSAKWTFNTDIKWLWLWMINNCLNDWWSGCLEDQVAKKMSACLVTYYGCDWLIGRLTESQIDYLADFLIFNSRNNYLKQ